LDDTPPSFLPFSEKGEALVSDVDYLDIYKVNKYVNTIHHSAIV